MYKMLDHYKFSNSIFTLLLLIILSGFACKTKSLSQTIPLDNKFNVQQSTNQPSVYPTEPGTCLIQGYILSILPIEETNIDEPCKSFACKANVIITKSSSCGFGVAVKPSAGDTLLVNFLHSIASSEVFKKVYPAKVILPGIKQDQLFEAQIKIKLLPNDKLNYVIGNYELIH